MDLLTSEKTLIFELKILKIIVIDTFLSVAFIMVPSFSHISLFPYYLFDPIKIILILAFLTTNKHNAIFLSIILPIISWQLSGHPIFPKFIIIIIENCSVIVIYLFLTQHVRINKLLLFNIAVISGKLIYYYLKNVLINYTIIEGSLISTPVNYQIGTLIILNLLLLFWILYERSNGNNTIN